MFKKFCKFLKKLHAERPKRCSVIDDSLVETPHHIFTGYESDISVEMVNKFDISSSVCTGIYRPDQFVTNDQAVFATISLFVPRTLFHQKLVIFNYNERSIKMDKFIKKELPGVLSSPWIPEITADMM